MQELIFSKHWLGQSGVRLFTMSQNSTTTHDLGLKLVYITHKKWKVLSVGEKNSKGPSVSQCYMIQCCVTFCMVFSLFSNCSKQPGITKYSGHNYTAFHYFFEKQGKLLSFSKNQTISKSVYFLESKSNYRLVCRGLWSEGKEGDSPFLSVHPWGPWKHCV